MPWLGHAGLALSIGLGAVVNAVWLFIGLRRGGWYRPPRGWGRFVAARRGGDRWRWAGLLALAAARIDWIGLVAHEGLRAAALAGVLGGAALVYFGVLLALGFRPRDFSRRA